MAARARLVFAWVLFAALWPSLGWGAGVSSARYSFDTYGSESGLPAMVVVAALQTRDGYLWMGTAAGLGRFDGARFVVFRGSNAPAFASDVILCLWEGRDGVLWIGTGDGLVRYREGVFERVGLPGEPVRTLAEGRHGEIWIGTSGQGLHVWRDGRVERVVTEALPADGAVRSLLVDSADRLWIALGRGVLCYENGACRSYEAPDFSHVLAMAETPGGTVWFGTQRQGLFRFADGVIAHFGLAEGVPRAAITDLQPARGGGLWIAAGTLHRAAVEPGQFSCTAIPGLPNDNVYAIREDHEGGLWLCARSEGLSRMRQMQYRSLSVKEGLPSDNVKNAAQDIAGNLWLGLRGEGVTQVRPDHSVKVHGESDGIPAREPAIVYPRRDGSVWASVYSRLYEWREGAWKRYSDLGAVRGLYEDRRGTMWIGTDAQGVFRVTAGEMSEVKLPSGEPILLATAFAEGPDGAMFIGTWRKGLYRVLDGEVSVHDRARGLPSDEVRAVYVDREGLVWVGIDGLGLAVLEKDRWMNPKTLTEILGSQVSAIAEDDQGRMWLGTLGGIMWAERRDLLAWMRGEVTTPIMHRIATSSDVRGIPVWSGAQPVVWRTADGELLFATRRGVVAVDPARVAINEAPPQVHIEHVFVDRHAADPARGVTIPAVARSLTIEYTALSFAQPNHVFFKYRLEGYDSDWVDAGTRRTAFYNSLPPGDYVFHVVACNNDGVWNTVGSRIAVVQLPHFYQMRWFYALLVVAAAGIGWALHRSSHRRLKFRLERLEQEQAMENERRRIAQDLHDELGANLTEIGLFANTVRRTASPEERQEMEFLSGRVRDLVGALDAIVWAVNPANDSLDQLVAYLGELFQELFRRSAIRGRLEIGPDIPAWPLAADERSNLFLTAKEAMNNVIKHSGATEARLGIRMTGDTLELVIEDNGRGFDPVAPEHAERNGLANMRTRLARLGGAITFRSSPGKGTVVTISVRFAGRKETVLIH